MKQKSPILALYRDGSSLEITRFEGGRFLSERIEGEEAVQKIAIDRIAKGATLVTGLGGSDLLFRTLELPLRGRRAILKALPFQLEHLLPYSLEEALILPRIRPKGRRLSSVEIFSARKKNLDAHLLFWQRYFVNPGVVSANICGLFCFVQKYCDKDVTLLHMGENESYLLAVKSGELQSAISLAVGRNSERAQIKREFFRALKFFGEDLPPILIGGGACEGVKELISGLLEEKASWVCDESLIDKASFALTMGLALEAAEGRGLQFRSGDRTPLAQRSKTEKKMVVFFGLLVVYLAIFTCTTQGAIRRKEGALAERFDALLFRCQKEIGPVQEVTVNASFEERVQRLSGVLTKVKGGTALEAPAPLVSDLLAYLAAHPKLQAGVEIKKVHYTLLSCPTVENLKARYEAQVELEISAISSEVANGFYEAMRKERKKIGWKRHEKGYKVSFKFS